jgi:membrane fusion protein (multidrug efflux system)
MDARLDTTEQPSIVPSEQPEKADTGAPVHAPPAPGAERRTWIDTIREHRVLAIAAAVVLIVALIALVIWWLNARHFESTDDAFIDARTAAISSQVNGAVVDVLVTDNQRVDAGAVMVRIDDRDYRSKVDQANAQIDQARANIANLDAQLDAQNARIEQATKQVTQAQAALTFAQQENDRSQQLAKTGSGTVQQAQQTASNLLQNQASLAAAQFNAIAATKQLAVLKTQRSSAAAQLEQANAVQEAAAADFARTTITAPVTGRITKLTAANGNYATVGQALMMLVPRETWITANFKETQLADMRPGQPVDIEVDAYPGRAFHGHVDSIQAGSGTAFSLLPPENATGNYVKVVQRVPVKIVLDQPTDVVLGPGMSVVPSVKVR